MQKKGNRLTALLLALCVVLGLAACGSGGDGEGENKNGGSAGQISGTVYVPEFLELDVGIDNVSGGCCIGKDVYISGEVNRGTDEEPDYHYVIYRVSLETGEAVELENYEPIRTFTSSEGYFSIHSITAGADGTLYVKEYANTYIFDLPEDFNEEEDDRWEYHTGNEVLEVMRQLDSTGKELRCIDISALPEKTGMTWNQSVRVDSEGDVYAIGGMEDGSEKLVVLDSELNVIFSLDADIWGGDMTFLSDGRAALRRRDAEGSFVLTAIDKAAKKWGDDYPLATGANNVYDGAGKYLFYYNSGDSLYGYNAETEEGEWLLSWSAADINMDRLSFFSFLEDGRLVAMTQDWGLSGRVIELALLTETDAAAAAADKTVLTYATMGLGSDERASIIKFNKTNGKYRIEIRDYSEYATEDDYQAGLTKLNTEILAGQVPDILSVNRLPIRQYGAKGLLEDLWPLIDSDPEISRDSLMTRVFEAAEQDGKLYRAFESFSIGTVIGSRKVVGDDLGWTLAEMREALAAMPEGCALFGADDTKDNMLRYVLAMNADSYVNWETGECFFNGEQFKSVLEFCNSFPLEYDWEANRDSYEDAPTRIAAGKQMLTTMEINGFGDFQIHEAMFAGEDRFKTITLEYNYSPSSGMSVAVIGGAAVSAEGDYSVSTRLRPGRYVTFKGFPMEDGGCGSTFGISNSLAISSTCKDKAGAWEYVREYLLPKENRKYCDNNIWGFPSNKADFDEMAAEAMEVNYITDKDGSPLLDEEGEPIQEGKGGWMWGNLDIDVMATTQEEYDQIMELYNAIESVADYDSSIYDIISDLAGSYFNGDKSLDETAELIQGRVQLYVNESK